MWLGGSINNLEVDELQDMCHQMKPLLKKGDMMAISVDCARDPKVIQGAYFVMEEQDPFNRFIMNSIVRINKELEGTFDLDKFYIHSYFNPDTKDKHNLMMAVSKENQVVSIRGKEIELTEYECIRLHQQRRWLGQELEEPVQIL